MYLHEKLFGSRIEIQTITVAQNSDTRKKNAHNGRYGSENNLQFLKNQFFKLTVPNGVFLTAKRQPYAIWVLFAEYVVSQPEIDVQ